MAIFLGSRGDNPLAWRGVADQYAIFRAQLLTKLSYLRAGEEIAFLQEIVDRLQDELAADQACETDYGELLLKMREDTRPDVLVSLHHKFRQIVADHFRQRGSVITFHQLCTSFSDALLRTTLDVAELMLQPEGGSGGGLPYCWLVSGTAGRHETTVTSSFPSVLVYRDAGDETAERCRRLGYQTMTILAPCGFDSGVAISPGHGGFWIGSLEEWQRFVEPRGKRGGVGVEFFDLLADLRPVGGDPDVAAEAMSLSGAALARLAEVMPMARIARRIVDMPVALGFFGGLRGERSGPHRGEVNLQQAALDPLLVTVRLLAVRHGAPGTSTLDRIKWLMDRRQIGVDLTERLLRAFHEFSSRLITAELHQQEGKETKTFVDPEALGEAEQELLVTCLEAVSNLQKIAYQALVDVTG